jgi:RHS repeat-associated protein
MNRLIPFFVLFLSSVATAVPLYGYCGAPTTPGGQSPWIVCDCDGVCGQDCCPGISTDCIPLFCGTNSTASCGGGYPTWGPYEFFAADCSKPSPQQVGQKQSCGGTRVGDPIELTTGTGIISRLDVSLPEATGDLKFYRTLNTNRVNWLSPGTSPLQGLPKMFGEAVSEKAPFWSSNFTALVYRPVGSNTVRLFDTNGNRTTYQWNPACSSGTINLASTNANEKPSDELWCVGTTGFVLLKADGSRETYYAQYDASRFFLSQLQNASGTVHASVNYGQPRDNSNATINGCPNPGGNYIPYVRSVNASPDVVDFQYAMRTLPDAGVSCNLHYMRVRGTPIAGYGYLGAVYPTIGPLLKAVRYGPGSTSFEESYSSTPPSTGATFSLIPQAISTLPDGGPLLFNGSGYGNIWPAYSFRQPNRSIFVDAEYGGVLTSSGNNYTFAMSGKSETRTLVAAPEYSGMGLGSRTVTCAPGKVCNAGTETWTRATNGPEFSMKTQAFGGDIRVTGAGTPILNGPWLPLSAHVGVDNSTSLIGLNTPGNCKGLECEWYEWQRIGTNHVKNTVTRSPSVLVPTDLKTVTKKYSSAGQLEAEIVSGYTKGVFSLSEPSNTVEYKHIATFYRPDSSGVTDPLGRVMRVDGPCFVSGPSETACANFIYPVTTYEYFPATPVGNNAFRLHYMRRWADGSLSGIPLVTDYSSYDVWGRPGTVIENGVTTNFAYDAEGHVISRTVVTPGGNRVWTFRYAVGKLRGIGYPEGNATRFCYDQSYGTDGGASASFQFNNTSANYMCADPTLPDGGVGSDGAELKAIVKAAALTGAATWTEAIRWFTVGDPRIAGGSPQFWTFGQAVPRQIQLTNSDVDNRVDAVVAGNVPTAAADRKRYWQDELISAIGHSFNAAPAFCFDTGTNAVSTKCTTIEYDAARRLSRVATPIALGAADIQTKLQHNTNGQLCDLAVGNSALSCNIAVSKMNPESVSFEYDDFGNLLSAALPNTQSASGGKGGVLFRYSQSNALLLQTELGTNSSRWYTVDQLGRRLTVNETYKSQYTQLYSFVYDSNVVPLVPGSGFTCFPAQRNTMGRLSSTTGPMGTTYFSYDEFGRLESERLIRPDGQCTGNSNVMPTTSYTYTPNGNLQTIGYPHGLNVRYNYTAGVTGGKDRPISITLPSTSPVRTLVSNITWEPFGGLRSYQLSALGGSLFVEKIRGIENTTPTAGFAASMCPSYATATALGTLTGKTTALFVSKTTGAGDLLKQQYKWQGNQLMQETSCILNDVSTAQIQGFGYDQGLRMTYSTFPQFTTTGGPFASEDLATDTRGNRNWRYVNGFETSTYAAPSNPDRLDSTSISAGISRTFAYDERGRTRYMNWPNDSTGLPSKSTYMTYNTGAGMADSAVRAASVVQGFASLSYEYIYDSNNRRRAKIYPTAERDEFFYMNGWQMIEDRGNGPYGPTTDEYVWLDGQPIAVRRTRFDANYLAAATTATTCDRDEPAACGFRFLMNDVGGRTVMVVDENRNIAAVNEHQPFGNMNRMSVTGDSNHPYGINEATLMATPTQPKRNLLLTMKVNFGSFDLEQGFDRVRILDTLGNTLQTMTGYHSSALSSSWLTPQADGQLRVWQETDSCNGDPGNSACSGYQYWGSTVESVDYRRWQAGAQYWAHRMRMPGQYFDAETGLFENWNRFYEPSLGRYLSEEPLLMSPRALEARAQQGGTMAAYSYASNNPIGRIDLNGKMEGVNPDFVTWPDPKNLIPFLLQAGAKAGPYAAAGTAAAVGGLATYYTLSIGAAQQWEPPAGIPYRPRPTTTTMSGSPSGGVPDPQLGKVITAGAGALICAAVQQWVNQYEVCVDNGLGNPFDTGNDCEYNCPSGKVVRTPSLDGDCLKFIFNPITKGN